ncbi:MAG TPA: Maf family nucleotide pyrophosphatase [Hyphomicrobiaceae bacterium]|jgi:septum formation protein|nr:Maf family nucleotide pyrophosphatase [Hyphomicrobiaceae bacterium]
MTSRPLILASGSPYRRKMLEAAGLSFHVVPADVDEAALKRGLAAQSPKPISAAVADALARAKAQSVSARHPDATVIGADQILALGDDLLDKPGDLAAARVQLERLRGKTHRLISAVVVAEAGKVLWTHVDEAVLTMRPFSREFLDRYLAEADPGLCQIVGAYEIEGPGIQLFERVEGDHFTIIGLPLVPLLAELRSRGVIGA